MATIHTTFAAIMACVTLLSDFGRLDASVAIVKGILLSTCPDLNIIDITHDVPPFQLQQASYLLASATRNFPAGTVHLALMDIFKEQNPVLAACSIGQQIYIVPDNGLLPYCLPQQNYEAYQLLAVTTNHSFQDWVLTAAHCIRELEHTPLSKMGLPPIQLRKLTTTLPIDNASIACEVIHIDQYENVVINFTRQQYQSLIKDGGRFQLNFIRYEEIRDIKTNYNEVSEGKKLCRFNSNDYLEICINKGKAASLFGLKMGGIHNNIKINIL